MGSLMKELTPGGRKRTAQQGMMERTLKCTSQCDIKIWDLHPTNADMDLLKGLHFQDRERERGGEEGNWRESRGKYHFLHNKTYFYCA